MNLRAIVLRNVTKRFGPTTALNSVTFDVLEGELFCYVGPNASGKTTTIRIMLGLLKPDAGEG